MDTNKTNYNIPVITAGEFNLDPIRYELRKGNSEGAPLCPYGKHFEWIGYDLLTKRYVRFTKSVFKRFMSSIEEE